MKIDLQKQLIEKMRGLGKPYFISIAASDASEMIEMLDKACTMEGVSAIELNMSCPNPNGATVTAYCLEVRGAHITYHTHKCEISHSAPFNK
jgi:S-adenosylmethionine/arginine decarboxylase-like enzyme